MPDVSQTNGMKNVSSVEFIMRRFILDWILPVLTSSIIFSVMAAGAIRLIEG